ncbi:MAG TPA: hypothetical protein VHF08_00110 [Nitrososphaeraceae archaeon]|nr:hypothetical protein [Nitrososphaeraceae archaeon]
MKSSIIVGLMSIVALAVVGAVGSLAAPVFAEDDGHDYKYLKCKKYDKDYDKYDDGDYFKLKCKKYKD